MAGLPEESDVFHSDDELLVDLTALLPPQGENRSTLTAENRRVTIEVFFDSLEGTDESSIAFIFENVSFFACATIPGVDSSRLPVSKLSGNGLVRLGSSDAARQWTRYWSRTKWQVSHYQLFLIEANQRYDVLAGALAIQNRAQRDEPLQ